VFELVKDPTMARDNFEMLFNVFEFCRLNMIKRIMFASSREVYGNSSGTLYAEDDVSIKHCESPYSATKIAGEALVTAYRQCYKMGFIILRFSNVYGKYDDSDRVVPNFIRVARLGKDLVVFGRDKLLDFTYISDCISGIVKSIEAFDRVKDNTFNIASGKGTTIVEVAQLIQSKIGTGGKIVVKENRKGEVVKFVADITKARQALNYDPHIGIALGLDKTIEYYDNMEEAK
jgi:UDP-glucose 4-epimerase